jgi:hypothetical protein
MASLRLLEARLRWHKSRAAYRRRQLESWTITGQRAHYWQNKHRQEGNRKAAINDQRGIERARQEIHKWKLLLDPEEIEIHKLENSIQKIKPRQQLWLAGGWVRPGTYFSMQRQDQGQDLEIPLYDSVVAPGSGFCVGYSSDRPFPNGFGNPYAIVHIESGRFGGNDWYLGHANMPIIRPGQRFSTGQPLARLNNSLNAGLGWIEIGRWAGGPGPMGTGEIYHHLFSPVWR